MKNNKLFRVKEYIIPSNKVVFIFTAMGTKIPMYKFFIKQLNKKGYSCVIYDYGLDFLFNATLKLWKKFFDEIILDAQKRIKKLKQKNVTNFYAYGASMGTLVANKFTRDTKEISHVILNMTYGDVADNIFTYRGVKKAKESFLKQGIDREKLRENIIYMDPVRTAKELKNKKVLLQLSRYDKVLLYKQTKYTLEAFRKSILDFEYEESKISGHYLTGIINLFRINRIDNFYKNSQK